MLAYANGEEIEVMCKDGTGIPNEDPAFNWFTTVYRVAKSKPSYRPFKNKDECWQEMLKHQPFGWIKDSGLHYMITSVSNRCIWLDEELCNDFDYIFNFYKFTDGTPFGIKEE